MNNRIRELIEQAHERKPVIVLDPETCQPTHKIGNGGVPMYHSELNPEKFAELIVKECVNRIEQNRSSGENTDSWTITRDMAFHQMKEDLKKHFGVEE